MIQQCSLGVHLILLIDFAEINPFTMYWNMHQVESCSIAILSTLTGYVSVLIRMQLLNDNQVSVALSGCSGMWQDQI